MAAIETILRNLTTFVSSKTTCKFSVLVLGFSVLNTRVRGRFGVTNGLA